MAELGLAEHLLSYGATPADRLVKAAVAYVLTELVHAEQKHPGWPLDTIHQAAIVAEEAGELVQASIDDHYKTRCPDRLRLEAAQTAAVCLRMLMATTN